MRVPNFIRDKILFRMMKVVKDRKPDLYIGGVENPYLKRWYVIPKNKIFNIYFHIILRSDEDSALHDHPWWNFSLLLLGRYVEHTINAGGIHVKAERHAGDFKFRSARSAHRIEIVDGQCWTLFVTGPRIREWGFHCPQGWRHWRIFTDPKDSGKIGRGCE